MARPFARTSYSCCEQGARFLEVSESDGSVKLIIDTIRYGYCGMQNCSVVC